VHMYLPRQIVCKLCVERKNAYMGMGFLVQIKSGGGMGLRRAQGINNVAELKRFWNCCNSKSIWARWLKDHYLKGRSLWEIKAQPVDSYVWKNIIAARQTASAHMYLPRQC